MSNWQTMRYEKDGPILRITLDRPEVRNATNVTFYSELHDCLDRADEDDDIRVIVLGANGPVFCAGQDFNASVPASRKEWARYLRLNLTAQDRIRTNRRPVIARVQGDAYGGGGYLVGACDLIVMMSHARMALREINAGDTAGGAFLWSIGRQRSLEMTLLGRPITGEEAERWNLINRSVDSEEELDAQVQDWVDQLLCVPPMGITATKASTNFALAAAGYDVHGAAPFNSMLEGTADRAEAKSAWLERRDPVFRGE